MKLFLVIFFSLFLFKNYSQEMPDFNIELLSHVPSPDLGGVNDVWGFEHSDGTEYAIIGSFHMIIIYSLEDLENPVEVARIEDDNTSIGRDIKSFNDFIYAVENQGESGILSIDMRNAPEDIKWTESNPGGLETAHNMFIDDKGYGYLSGGNLNDGGLVIIDCFTNQETPSIVGFADARYSHDVYVRNDTAFSSDIFSGFFSVIDVTDKMEPITLATQSTSKMFSHNAWSDDSGKLLFTTDELENANVDAYSISDINDIRRLDTWHPEATEGMRVIPHNTQYLNGFLITSYYTDGIKIIDVNRPTNMVEVGSFDTYLDTLGGFRGCWGVYPFLKSGVILASDWNRGLFVLKPTYERATYLEGVVLNAITGNPINQAEVVLEGIVDFDEFTSSTGSFRTGQYETGNFNVHVSHPEYHDAFLTVELIQGEVSEIIIELTPKQAYTISGVVVDSISNEPIGGAVVLAVSNDIEFRTVADAYGNYTLSVLEGSGQLIAGNWGYYYMVKNGVVFNEDLESSFRLIRGYQDDFIVDYGWVSSGDALEGFWTLDKPIGTQTGNIFTNPNGDIPSDLGFKCYMTGNGGGHFENDDVDGGRVILTSPFMNIGSFIEPVVSFNYRFVNFGNPKDSLKFYFITPSEGEILVDFYKQSEASWSDKMSYNIKDFIGLSDSFRVSFVTSDDELPENISEAAIDQFYISSEFVIANQNIKPIKEVSVSPNPFDREFLVDISVFSGEKLVSYSVTDVRGCIVEAKLVEFNAKELILGSNYAKGLYFLQVKGSDFNSQMIKLIKK